MASRMQINLTVCLSLWSPLLKEWRKSGRDTAPLQDQSTARHSEAALDKTEEDKTFQYSIILQSYWLKHCNHFQLIIWLPDSK